MAYSYSCADCEGMETCPGKVIAETEEEVWKLVELHAKIAHDEDANEWDEETRKYIKTLIKTV
ncbi:MAG: putative small metal-binding protein [Parasphingorhabdus sp.]|jgi:predicted small metal-binding protein